MKWFNKWFANKCKQAWEDHRKDENRAVDKISVGLAVAKREGPDIDGLRFNVMVANGGTIVQVNHYNRRTDNHSSSTHVIPDGEPVAERIGQIVSMEILKS